MPARPPAWSLLNWLPQDQAELYCESLRQHGLISTLEPAGGGSGSGSDGTST